MTKEQEEVIEYLKEEIKYFERQIKFIETTECDYYDEELELYKNKVKEFNTILSMLEEKDKIIDLMVEEIDKNIGSVCPFIDYHYDLNCKNECKDDYKKCWKKFFENKAKEK